MCKVHIVKWKEVKSKMGNLSDLAKTITLNGPRFYESRKGKSKQIRYRNLYSDDCDCDSGDDCDCSQDGDCDCTSDNCDDCST